MSNHEKYLLREALTEWRMRLWQRGWVHPLHANYRALLERHEIAVVGVAS